MLSVYFFGADNELVGELHYEDGEFTRIPEDSVLLRNVLKEPVYLPSGGEVHSDEDPEAFMVGLHFHYKSYALRASEALDDED